MSSSIAPREWLAVFGALVALLESADSESERHVALALVRHGRAHPLAIHRDIHRPHERNTPS
jgi:hypothetical protein